MAPSKELIKKFDNIIEAKEKKKTNSMHIIEFNRQSIIFLVVESLNPR